MAKVTKKIVIKATPDQFFKVIRDYESYPEFLSSVSDTKLLENGKSMKVVEFEADLIKKIHYTLELTEAPPSRLSWKLREGDFMKKNTGAWKLKARGKETEATYEIEVEMKGLVPNFVVAALVEQTLPKTLDEFRLRAEQRTKKSPSRET